MYAESLCPHATANVGHLSSLKESLMSPSAGFWYRALIVAAGPTCTGKRYSVWHCSRSANCALALAHLNLGPAAWQLQPCVPITNCAATQLL
mmetsp:Transcript_8394/g.12814  ORF Transcript_8394/g.12814 Transcript_8394/m.12814 type:complete len:92 (-) Transcript_8394:172-447(-)